LIHFYKRKFIKKSRNVLYDVIIPYGNPLIYLFYKKII